MILIFSPFDYFIYFKYGKYARRIFKYILSFIHYANKYKLPALGRVLNDAGDADGFCLKKINNSLGIFII